MSETEIEQERTKLELDRLLLERERLEFEQKKKSETLLFRNFGSVIAAVISFVAILVSATQVYIAWEQRRLAEAQTVERFFPHLLKSESRDMALTTMDAFVERKLVTALAAKFESSSTLEKFSTRGSPEEKRVAQEALDALAVRRSLLIRQMFDNDKNVRVQATTTLSREWNSDPKVVSEALAFANSNRANPNRSGIINTLLLFQAFDPLTLRGQHEELMAFLEAVKSYGPQSLDHANKVKALLEKQPSNARTSLDDGTVVTRGR